MIHYDGVGADPSGVHTDERFLEIMKRDTENKKWQRRPQENVFNWIYENEIQLNIDRDINFKAGLFNQTESFLKNNNNGLVSLEDQIKAIRIYYQIAGY
jgi:hypothetical protein